MRRSEIKKRPMADTVLAGLEPEAKEYRENDGNGLYRKRPGITPCWQVPSCVAAVQSVRWSSALAGV